MTGLVVIVTGYWNSGLQGSELTLTAFESGMGSVARALIALSIFLFGLTTSTGWFTYYSVILKHWLKNNQKVFKIAEKVFIPFTVGGGIRTVDDFKAILREGADKISINSSAINTPNLINDAADKFGSQCVVVAIDAKRRADGSGWNVYKNGGRIDVGLDAVESAMEANRRGAGEILLTSMDCDGTKAGYDNELTRIIAENVDIPVIASGGAGNKEHFYDTLTEGKADAALAASLFHFNELKISDLKEYLDQRGISVRR